MNEAIHLTDVVIVGGGVYGSAVAYELSCAGLGVVLLERDEIASGASGGVGLRGVRATGRDLRELPLMSLAYSRWARLSDELQGDTGFRRTGGLMLFENDTATNPRAMASVRARVSVQEAWGVPTQLIDAETVRELEPGVSHDVVGAIYTPLDGVVDHTATTRSYARAAARRGASVIEHAEVSLIESRGDLSIVTTADGLRFTASRAVVVLANSHAPALLTTSFGMGLPVWRYNPQATTVRARDGGTINGLVNHMSRRFSAKAISSDLVMLTGNHGGTWDELHDVGVADPAVTAASLHDAPVLFPGLADAVVVGIDASRGDSVSVDDVPFIDRVPGAPQVLFGLGWSGHGFAIAPAVARLLSEWVLTDKRPGELEPFGIARLGLHSAVR